MSTRRINVTCGPEGVTVTPVAHVYVITSGTDYEGDDPQRITIDPWVAIGSALSLLTPWGSDSASIYGASLDGELTLIVTAQRDGSLYVITTGYKAGRWRE